MFTTSLVNSHCRSLSWDNFTTTYVEPVKEPGCYLGRKIPSPLKSIVNFVTVDTGRSVRRTSFLTEPGREGTGFQLNERSQFISNSM